ncbi:MAG: PAS domain S-box protein [Myxococcales bacterium]
MSRSAQRTGDGMPRPGAGPFADSRAWRVLRPPRLPWFLRYAATPALTFLAYATERAVVSPPVTAPFVSFYAAVAVAAWVGGRGPGLATTALSTVAALSLAAAGPDPASGVPLGATVLFALTASLVALLCGALRTAMLVVEARASGLRVALDEKARAEEALRASEQKHRGLFEHMNEAIVIDELVVDERGAPVNWRVVDVNPAYERLTGRSRDALVGRLTTEIYGEQFPKPYLGQVADMIRTGEAVQLEGFFAPIGRYVVISAFPLGGARFALLMMDVTERKRVEEALREEDYLLSESQRLAHIGTWSMALGADRIRWTEETYRIYGQSPDSFVPTMESLFRSIHEDDRPAMQEWVRACIAGERPGPLEFRAVRPDGSVRMLVGRGDLQRPHEHFSLSLVGTVQDVTESKRAEETQRRTAAILDALSLATPALIFAKDLQARMTYCSPSFCKVVGLEESQILGKRSDEFLASRGGEAHTANDRWVMEHGESRTFEESVETPQGRRIYLSAKCPYRDAQGRLAGLAAVSLDVSDSKRMEEALREADRRKSEFLGVLSHELRNPLSPIRTSAFLLGKSTSLSERDRRAVTTIDRQVNHLARLIDDLLDVTRIARGKIRLQRATFDLVDALRRVVEDHREAFGSREVSIAFPDEPLWVDGDATRIAQAASNLLGNAAKFTPAGGRVSLSVRRDDSKHAVVEVSDTGVGIDPETLSRLFVPFAQADRSLDRSRGGLGLGLALVRGIVELHGGSVSAHSPGPGFGATFTVKLPLARPEGLAVAEEPRLRAGDGQGRRVLVIEDNPDTAASLSELLELDGYQIAVARAGAEGVAKAREFLPDYVLCDIGLPEMNGYEVARALRRDPEVRSTFLVALTGYAQPEDQQRAREAGFDAHVAKPPDLAALEQLLARAPRRPAHP